MARNRTTESTQTQPKRKGISPGAGFALGILLFAGTKAYYAELPMASPPAVIVKVALGAFASCTLASLVAVRRVLSVDSAIVFRS